MAKANITLGSVTMTQTGFNQFTVQYGKSIKTGLNYGAAASEFGACVMHEAACESRIDNRTIGEAREAGDRVPYFTLGE